VFHPRCGFGAHLRSAEPGQWCRVGYRRSPEATQALRRPAFTIRIRTPRRSGPGLSAASVALLRDLRFVFGTVSGLHEVGVYGAARLRDPVAGYGEGVGGESGAM